MEMEKIKMEDPRTYTYCALQIAYVYLMGSQYLQA
jgi:hypothetical protein